MSWHWHIHCWEWLIHEQIGKKLGRELGSHWSGGDQRIDDGSELSQEVLKLCEA